MSWVRTRVIQLSIANLECREVVNCLCIGHVAGAWATIPTHCEATKAIV
jgi:hypothetical protein